MIILLDTATATCMLTIVSGDSIHEEQWVAERKLAKELLSFLQKKLQAYGFAFSNIGGIGVYEGPGSFTGLRIGITVLNTLADTMQIPIVGETGDDWKNEAMKRIKRGDNDRIVLPFYGSDANITKPRK